MKYTKPCTFQCLNFELERIIILCHRMMQHKKSLINVLYISILKLMKMMLI